MFKIKNNINKFNQMKAILNNNWFKIEKGWVLINPKDYQTAKGYYLDTYNNKIHHTNGADFEKSTITKQILGATFEINGIPLILLKDEVKELAFANAKTKITNTKERCINDEILISGARIIGFTEGYSQVKSKYKYTEEDLGDIIQICIELQSSVGGLNSFKAIKEFNRLNQPKGIEFETVELFFTNSLSCENILKSEDLRDTIFSRLKVIPHPTHSAGQLVIKK